MSGSAAVTGRVADAQPLFVRVEPRTEGRARFATSGAPGRGDADLDAIYCIYAL